MVNDQIQYEVNGQWHCARVINHENRLWFYDADGDSQLQAKVSDYNQQDEQQGSLKAPMNGTIIQVATAAGPVSYTNLPLPTKRTAYTNAPA